MALLRPFYTEGKDDRVRIGLLNLILNDIVYTDGERGRIHVRVQHRGDSLQSEFLGKDRANNFH